MCLESLIGFKQSIDSNCYPILSDALTVSDNGVYVNDFHPLLTTDNIVDTFQEFNLPIYTPWSGVDPYLVGAIVEYSGSVYQCIQNSTGDQPDISPLFWNFVQLVPSIENKLLALRKRSADNLKRKVQEKKFDAGYKTTLVDNSPVFDGVGASANNEPNQGGFCGIAIQLYRAKGLKISLNRLAFQSTALQTLRIWVYNTTQSEAIYFQDCVINKINGFAWVDFKLDLFFDSLDYGVGGDFLIGYYQADLVGSMVSNTIFNWNRPCYTCGSAYNAAFYPIRSRYTKMTPVFYPASALNGTDLPTLSEGIENPQRNFGLNLSFSVACDPDLVFCDNKTIFTEALGWQMAYDILNEMANSLRLNSIKMEAQLLAKDALKDVKAEVDRSISVLSIDFSQINSPCFPCISKNGVNYKTIR